MRESQASRPQQQSFASLQPGLSKLLHAGQTAAFFLKRNRRDTPHSFTLRLADDEAGHVGLYEPLSMRWRAGCRHFRPMGPGRVKRC
ncbi:MAG: hypothetical protein RLZZ57_928 [Pseudomonadota bacterium]